MQFIIILRESHVADKDGVAHTRFSITVSKEEEVVAVFTESFLRQLSAPSASLLYNQCRAGFIALQTAGVEGDGKVSVWQTGYLTCKLHGMSAWQYEFIIYISLFHDTNLVFFSPSRKDESYFPRMQICAVHIVISAGRGRV